jgi:hypothetical protein
LDLRLLRQRQDCPSPHLRSQLLLLLLRHCRLAMSKRRPFTLTLHHRLLLLRHSVPFRRCPMRRGLQFRVPSRHWLRRER